MEPLLRGDPEGEPKATTIIEWLQEHYPRREAEMDFTHGNSLGVTIAGQSLSHLLFQLILSHSGWRYAESATGETFLALKR